MKKVFSILAIAAALIFTVSSCEKSTPQSSLQSLNGTTWTGTASDEETTWNYTYVFGTYLDITVEVVGGLTNEIKCTYTYNNPVVTYKSTTSSNTGSGTVAQDGKTMTVNNILLTRK